MAAWQARRAAIERDAARRDASREEAVRYQLTRLFRTAIEERGSQPATAKAMIDNSALRVLREYRSQPQFEGQIVLTLADLYGACRLEGRVSLLESFSDRPARTRTFRHWRMRAKSWRAIQVLEGQHGACHAVVGSGGSVLESASRPVYRGAAGRVDGEVARAARERRPRRRPARRRPRRLHNESPCPAGFTAKLHYSTTPMRLRLPQPTT